jgi:uncharacterized paraquat-inducible protein A
MKHGTRLVLRCRSGYRWLAHEFNQLLHGQQAVWSSTIDARATAIAGFMVYTAPAAVVGVVACGLLNHFCTRRRKADGETRCRKCGYVLRGITEPRCPECGERI